VLFAARRTAETAEFDAVYRKYRPMVERAAAWIVRGNRQPRYRGTAKNDWLLHHRVAAINLRRLLTLVLHHLHELGHRLLTPAARITPRAHKCNAQPPRGDLHVDPSGLTSTSATERLEAPAPMTTNSAVSSVGSHRGLLSSAA
jgi:Transposase DDE domain